MRLVGDPDLCQFFAIALVGLQVPPAGNILTVTQFLNDLLDGLFGDTYFFRDLRANAIEFSRNGQFQVACFDLGNLLGCRLKRLRRRNFLLLRFGWGRRPGCLWFGGFPTVFACWRTPLRARFTWGTWSWATTRLHRLTRTLPERTGHIANAIGGRAMISAFSFPFSVSTRTTAATRAMLIALVPRAWATIFWSLWLAALFSGSRVGR